MMLILTLIFSLQALQLAVAQLPTSVYPTPWPHPTGPTIGWQDFAGGYLSAQEPENFTGISTQFTVPNVTIDPAMLTPTSGSNVGFSVLLGSSPFLEAGVYAHVDVNGTANYTAFYAWTMASWQDSPLSGGNETVVQGTSDLGIIPNSLMSVQIMFINETNAKVNIQNMDTADTFMEVLAPPAGEETAHIGTQRAATIGIHAIREKNRRGEDVPTLANFSQIYFQGCYINQTHNVQLNTSDATMVVLPEGEANAPVDDVWIEDSEHIRVTYHGLPERHYPGAPVQHDHGDLRHHQSGGAA